MKHTLLLSALFVMLLSSCSTAFKSGQTPDDVYYSPARELTVKEEEKQKTRQDEYRDYVSSQDDRYLHMKVANRNRWNSLDDFEYWNDTRYDFYNYHTAWNTYNYSWNPSWNLSIGSGRRSGYGNYGWNNPVYTVVYYANPKFAGGGSTTGSNISAYKNKTYDNTNLGYKDPKTGSFVPAGNNNNFGNLLKRVFTGSSDNNSAGSYDRPARTFSNSTTTPNSTNTTPATSSSAGGNSGGFKSTGSSTGTGRGGKG